jgi:hypothetical protein
MPLLQPCKPQFIFLSGGRGTLHHPVASYIHIVENFVGVETSTRKAVILHAIGQKRVNLLIKKC